MYLYTLLAAAAITGLAAVISGILRIVAGKRTRGSVLIAAGVLIAGAGTWKYLREREKRIVERQIKQHEAQAPVEPYPED